MDKSEIKAFIAKRVAKELKDGDVVNLGIGLPTLVPAYLPEGVHVILQSENGIIGTGAKPTAEEADPHFKIDAGGSPAQAAVFGCYIDSATSFGFIRGGHVNATILGGLEVDQEGSLSNWIIPGKKMPGMGGAMDLVVGARRIVVVMDQVAKNGSSKIVADTTLPLTGLGCVDRIITELGVFDRDADGLTLVELVEGVTLEQIEAATDAPYRVADSLR